MGNRYELMEPLTTEYEWDRGPMPSGYARVRLQLQPSCSTENVVCVISAPGRIWQVRPTEYARKQDPGRAERSVESFMPAIIEGVRKGVEYALMHSLDRPVANVAVVLEEVTVDLVYSTEIAFYTAAKSALEQLLKLAAEGGMLRVHPEN